MKNQTSSQIEAETAKDNDAGGTTINRTTNYKRPYTMASLAFLAIILLCASTYAVLRLPSDEDGAKMQSKQQADVNHSVPLIDLNNGQTYEMSAGYVDNSLAGKTQPMLAYNGSIPGPEFRVSQGSSVAVRFNNRIGSKTTIHAHGLRQRLEMDGMPDVSQPPIEDGDSFTYNWTFPDPGVYWYHPHVRQDYQQASGLYGAIVVQPKDPNYWPQADKDQVLVLSDVLVNESGTLVPYSAEQVDHTLMGRYGNVMLVNGQKDYVVKATDPTRLYGSWSH